MYISDTLNAFHILKSDLVCNAIWSNIFPSSPFLVFVSAGRHFTLHLHQPCTPQAGGLTRESDQTIHCGHPVRVLSMKGTARETGNFSLVKLGKYRNTEKHAQHRIPTAHSSFRISKKYFQRQIFLHSLFPVILTFLLFLGNVSFISELDKNRVYK